MKIWKYIVVLIFLILNLNTVLAEEGQRRQHMLAEHEKLVQQFDEWVFPNHVKTGQEIIKPSLGPIGIAFSVENNGSISGVLRITIRNLYKLFYSIELKQYQSEYVLKGKHPRNPFNPKVGQKKQNPIDIAFFNDNYEDFKWSIDAYSESIEKMRNNTFRSEYTEVGEASNCIYRRYMKQSKWFFWENVYVDKTFVYIRNRFSEEQKSDLKIARAASRDAYVCILGAILYHYGVSNIYKIISEKSDELVPYPEGERYAYGARMSNMFPLWALRRPEIKPGMTRKKALETVKRLAPIWWAKCCDPEAIRKKYKNP